MLTFEFTDIDDDRAAMLAQRLRPKLIEHGAKPDDLAFVGALKSLKAIRVSAAFLKLRRRSIYLG